jgi:hypothetical protein
MEASPFLFFIFCYFSFSFHILYILRKYTNTIANGNTFVHVSDLLDTGTVRKDDKSASTYVPPLTV